MRPTPMRSVIAAPCCAAAVALGGSFACFRQLPVTQSALNSPMTLPRLKERNSESVLRRSHRKSLGDSSQNYGEDHYRARRIFQMP